jgi:hypothetical protein
MRYQSVRKLLKLAIRVDLATKLAIENFGFPANVVDTIKNPVVIKNKQSSNRKATKGMLKGKRRCFQQLSKNNGKIRMLISPTLRSVPPCLT